MKTFLEILFVLTASVVPGCVVGLLAGLHFARKSVPEPQMNTEELLKPSGGYWILQIKNMENGEVLYRIFRKQLILGRTLDIREQTGRLYIGEEDYISRYQCALTVTPDGLFLSNLSHSNATMHNGRQVNTPERINSGDEISVGPHRWKLLGISPAVN